MKVYNGVKHEMGWSSCDLYGRVEDAWFEVLDVINSKRMDGHDMYDQWLILVERRINDLLTTLGSCPMTLTEQVLEEDVI